MSGTAMGRKTSFFSCLRNTSRLCKAVQDTAKERLIHTHISCIVISCDVGWNITGECKSSEFEKNGIKSLIMRISFFCENTAMVPDLTIVRIRLLR